MRNINSASFVSKAKNGNNDAFISLIEENITSIYRVAKGILNIEEDVEDAIQSAILIAYRSIKNLKNDDLFKTWIIRIVINESNKIYNLNKKCIDIEKMKEKYVNDKYTNLDLQRAIDNLPEELKIIILLFYFEDLKISQIADILKIPEGTVKSKLSRAKSKIANYIGKEEVM
ncbi:MAG: sigma-70 family RNA polymerase sigma factor [Escherichia coli]|jgi:RNA polymerase sigma-70 factor (ECF subfamily)|nr:sigma-70 family RNA polymerase sigma factor [Escherichia coli]